MVTFHVIVYISLYIKQSFVLKIIALLVLPSTIEVVITEISVPVHLLGVVSPSGSLLIFICHYLHKSNGIDKLYFEKVQLKVGGG